jgi:DNA-binding CsgD family transcriptional regulator
MRTRINEGFGALTEKEKQTLRLIVRSHGAKSIACSLGLSVHTINETQKHMRNI